MPISTVTNRVAFQGNGSSAVFSFPYQLQAQSHLSVFVYNSSVPLGTFITPQVLNTDYTFSGTANAQGIYPSGGNVIMNSAPSSQAVMVLFRSSVITNTFNVGQNQTIPSTALNQEVDYLTLIMQRLNDQTTRSLHLADGFAPAFDTTIIPQAITPNALLVINSSATGFAAGPDATLLINFQSSIVGAAASAATAVAAAISAGSAAVSAVNQVVLANSAAVSAGNLAALMQAPSAVTVSAAYTAQVTDTVIIANSSGYAVKLYSPVGNTSKKIEIHRGALDSTHLGIVTTVTCSGAAFIGSLNVATLNLCTADETYGLVSDGTNWKILNHNVPQRWTRFSGTFAGLSAPQSVSLIWSRDMADVLIKGTFIVGGGTAAEARIPLPTGVGSSALITSANGSSIPTLQVCGNMVTTGTSATLQAIYPLVGISQAYFRVGVRTTTQGGNASDNGNVFAFVGTSTIGVDVRIPVDGWGEV